MTDGQSKQIEQLYHELFKPLTAYALSVLRSRALAEEAVQEVFRIACTKPASLCESPNPRGWLLVTLKNVLKNVVRSMASANRLTETVRQQTRTADTDPVNIRLLYGPLADTDEFRLMEGVAAGKTMLELAREQGITVEACKKRVQRAREYLKKRI